MRRCLSCFLLAALVALAGCEGSHEAREWRASDHAQPEAPDDSRASPDDAEAGPATIAQAAAALYSARCAVCHGADGRGAGHGVTGMAVPDLTRSDLSTRTDEELAQVIREGRGMMPGFGSELNARGIAALVAHIRTLRQPE